MVNNQNNIKKCFYRGTRSVLRDNSEKKYRFELTFFPDTDELYDLPLKNETKLFNEEYLIKKQEEEKNFLNKAVRSYLKIV